MLSPLVIENREKYESQFFLDASIILAATLRLSSSILFGLIFSFTGIFGIASWLSDTGRPTFFGHEVLIVQSGSMAPVFHAGDVALIRQITISEARELDVGDIITFRNSSQPQTLVTHRIDAIDVDQSGELSFVTKGDANQSSDLTSVKPGDVEGAYSTRIDGLGYLLNAISERHIALHFAFTFLLAHIAVVFLLDLKQQTKETQQ